MKHLYANDYVFLRYGSKGVCDSFWLTYDKSEYLFKYNLSDTFVNFGERLYSILGKALEINVVETQLASCCRTKNKTQGVMVKSFLHKDEKSISLIELLNQEIAETRVLTHHDCFLVNAIEHVKNYAQSRNLIFDEQKAKKHLLFQCVLDYFFCQNDRHLNNVELISNGKELKFAPIFDNGCCLAFDKTEASCYKCLEQKCVVEPRSTGYISILGGNWLQQPKEIAQICKKNPEVKKLVSRILDLNLGKVIEVIEKENGQKLPKSVLKLSKNMFENRKNEFLKINKNKNNSDDLNIV